MLLLDILLFIALISNAFATADTTTAEADVTETVVEGAGGTGDYYKRKGPVCKYECKENEECIEDETYIYGQRRLGGYSKPSYIKGICVSKCKPYGCAYDEICVEDKRRGSDSRWSKKEDGGKGPRRLGFGGWNKPEPDYKCVSRCRDGKGCHEPAEVCVPKKGHGGSYKPRQSDRRRLTGERGGERERETEKEFECRCADGYYWNKWADRDPRYDGWTKDGDKPRDEGRGDGGWGKRDSYRDQVRRLSISEPSKGWDKPSGRCEEKCGGEDCGPHGRCEKTLWHTYKCRCDWDYEGEKCDQKIRPCDDPDRCLGGKYGGWKKGTETQCIPQDQEPGYKCVDPCDHDPPICKHNGMCVNTLKDGIGYVCMCDCPTFGDQCENECAENSDCPGDSECMIGVDDDPNTCVCPAEFSILADDLDTCDNPCDTNPCVNGVCTPAGGQPTCVCNTGWDLNDMRFCTIDINECDTNPCANNGECFDRPNGDTPECCCPDGFSGAICDIQASPVPKPCDKPDPCLNGFKCRDGESEAICVCPEGTGQVGDDCVPISGFCPGGPDGGSGIVCDENADCTDGTGSNPGTCACKDGYEGNGKDCTDINECNRNLDDCVRKATCVNTDGGFECNCKFPFKFRGDGKESGTGCRLINPGGGNTDIGGSNTPETGGSGTGSGTGGLGDLDLNEILQFLQLGGSSDDDDDDDDDDRDDARVGIYTIDQNSLSNGEGIDIKSAEKPDNNDKEIKWTLDISPWLLYISCGVLILFIVLNYALCYYQSMINKRNVTEKIRYKIDDNEDTPLSDDA